MELMQRATFDIELEKSHILLRAQQYEAFEIKYNKRQLNPPERTILTLFAEQHNFATYTKTEGTIEYFIVGSGGTPPDPPKVQSWQDLGSEPTYVNGFTYFFEYPITPLDWVKEINLYGLQTEAELYFKELQKYGWTGLKRRNIVLTQKAVDVETTRTLTKSNELPELDLYCPEHHQQLFISISDPNALFRHRVIPATSWDEFIRKHLTQSELFIRSPVLRQNILTKLDLKKIQEVYLRPLYQQLLLFFGSRLYTVYDAGETELIITTNEDTYLQDLRTLREAKLADYWKISCFEIGGIPPVTPLLLPKVDTPIPPIPPIPAISPVLMPKKDTFYTKTYLYPPDYPTVFKKKHIVSKTYCK